MSKNIIFILGAGFSRAAGLPLQRELLPEIMSFTGGDFHFKNAQDNIRKFISETFSGVRVEHLTLEDLFTILDKAVLGKEYFGGYQWQNLYEIRKGLVYTLLVLINKKMSDNMDRRALYKGMGRLAALYGEGKNEYNVGVISLNWDTLFEAIINESGNQATGNGNKINYGVYSHSLAHPDEKHSATSPPAGTVNVLKLHGSINWLYCPNCGRLYIDRYKNIAVDHEAACPHCTDAVRDIRLEEMIITPTMLKEFHNHHLRLTWQRAFIELNRADTVIFVGYSFPLADFELRYLFKKALSKDAPLNIVLHTSDKTSGTKERYEGFFGPNIQFCFDGFEGWWGHKASKMFPEALNQ